MGFLKDTRLTLILVWPLLLGMYIIMVGNGLQGTLLSLRADIAGFPALVIGIIMSLYYCGYLGGWYMVPRMIQSVGHIRVFAGFASLASTTILLQGLYIDPYVWSCVRILNGLSFVGLFIVAESWLNDTASNKLRGQIVGAYIFVLHFGLFTGQLLINLAPIEQIDLFIAVSILVSLSLIPITLANKPSPGYKEPEHLAFMKLIKISPYSVACVIVSGFSGAAMLTMGPLYGTQQGFTVPEISLFMAAFVLGCGLLPLPIGWLSDQIDRRKIIIIISMCGFILAGMAFLQKPPAFLVIIFLFGGCVTSLYTISSALLNDRLRAGQRTSATASLILISGISSCLSPIIIGALMQTAGAYTFFISFSMCFFLLFVYGLYRAFAGPKINVETQGEHYAPSPRILNPNILEVKKKR